MKTISLNEQKIFSILSDVNDGQKVKDVCSNNYISRQTFYNFKKMYKGLTLSEIKQIIDLKEQLLKTKKELREKELEVDSLKDLIEKKL